MLQNKHKLTTYFIKHNSYVYLQKTELQRMFLKSAYKQTRQSKFSKLPIIYYQSDGRH